VDVGDAHVVRPHRRAREQRVSIRAVRPAEVEDARVAAKREQRPEQCRAALAACGPDAADRLMQETWLVVFEQRRDFNSGPFENRCRTQHGWLPWSWLSAALRF